MLNVSNYFPFPATEFKPVDHERAVHISERFIVDMNEGSVVGVPHVHGAILARRNDVRTARRDATRHLKLRPL